MAAAHRSGNGRVPARRPPPDDGLPALRRRSPIAYWTAVIVLLGMVASVLGGVVISLAR
jgi:hypothetical protein